MYNDADKSGIPSVFAQILTYNNGDPCALRYTEKTNEYAEAFV